MTQGEILANRFREVILHGTWIANTNFKNEISELSWEEATLKIKDFNTIAALTFHINYYTEGLVNVLKGGSLEISDKYSFNLPEINSQAQWDTLKNSLFTNAETFAQLVSKLPEEKFSELFVDAKYGTYLRNIDGAIEHSYYHLGQIVLVKKLLITADR